MRFGRSTPGQERCRSWPRIGRTGGFSTPATRTRRVQLPAATTTASASYVRSPASIFTWFVSGVTLAASTGASNVAPPARALCTSAFTSADTPTSPCSGTSRPHRAVGVSAGSIDLAAAPSTHSLRTPRASSHALDARSFTSSSSSSPTSIVPGREYSTRSPDRETTRSTNASYIARLRVPSDSSGVSS